MNKLTVVVPAFNEAESLESFLPRLISYCSKKSWKLIVVNDGSQDSTPEILDQYGTEGCLTVLHHKLNRGYGAALKTGIMAVDTDIAVTIDADGQHDPSEVEKLLDVFNDRDADLVIGSRLKQKVKSRYRSLGKWLIRKVARLLTNVPIKDINSGMKMYRTGPVQAYIWVCPDSMAFSDVMTLIFIREKFRVLEVPIKIEERKTGKSTVTTRTALETVLEILNMVTLCNPMRIFLPASLAFTIFGVAWGLPLALQGRGVSTGSMLGILIGLLMFMLGLIAEQISSIRIENVRRKRG